VTGSIQTVLLACMSTLEKVVFQKVTCFTQNPVFLGEKLDWGVSEEGFENTDKADCRESGR